MGIAIETMLRGDFFRNFTVVAGHRGLSKHIQGVAVLDAPDGFKWTTGREFVISSMLYQLQDSDRSRGLSRLSPDKIDRPEVPKPL